MEVFFGCGCAVGSVLLLLSGWTAIVRGRSLQLRRGRNHRTTTSRGRVYGFIQMALAALIVADGVTGLIGESRSTLAVEYGALPVLALFLTIAGRERSPKHSAGS